MTAETLSPDLFDKWQHLYDDFATARSCVVAFSGGVDSSLLALAAYRALGDRAMAIYLSSETSTETERETARSVAAEIGIPFQVMQGDEFADPDFIGNGVDRCYHCKKVRFTQLLHWGKDNHFDLMVEGSNADDKGDYRPGGRAARELGIRAPLAECGFTKNEIRQLARYHGLSNWDLPAAPCLATRIEYDLPLTSERLKRVAAAEEFLISQGITPVRVRLHVNELVRIETSPEHIVRFADMAFRESAIAKLGELGFRFVTLDLSGFQSGSMNRGIVPGKSGG